MAFTHTPFRILILKVWFKISDTGKNTGNLQLDFAYMDHLDFFLHAVLMYWMFHCPLFRDLIYAQWDNELLNLYPIYPLRHAVLGISVLNSDLD